MSRAALEKCDAGIFGVFRQRQAKWMQPLTTKRQKSLSLGALLNDISLAMNPRPSAQPEHDEMTLIECVEIDADGATPPTQRDEEEIEFPEEE